MNFREAKKAIKLILGPGWEPPKESARLAQAAREEASKRSDLDRLDRAMVDSLAEAAEIAWNHNPETADRAKERVKAVMEAKRTKEDR